MTKKRQIRAALAFVMAALCIAGFYDTASTYADFKLPYGIGIINIHMFELGFFLWYFTFGMAAISGLTVASLATTFPNKLIAAFEKISESPKLFLCVATSALFLFIMGAKQFIFEYAPISDDESTYDFIAKTLLQGSLANPTPEDYVFFDNQFVVINEQGWFGKYPIGHPLVLAVGMALQIEKLIIPLLACGTLLITYLVGKKLFGYRAALAGTALLLFSPQFVLTSATSLSQPTTTFFTLLGVWAMIELSESGRKMWALLAGFSWGYCMLARPMPGVLFIIAAAASFLWSIDWKRFRSVVISKALEALLLGAPIAIAALVLLYTNNSQTGALLRTGYHEAHGGLGIVNNFDPVITVSLIGAFIRQNFWLFGWPLSFAFLFFAKGRRGVNLLWLIVAAEYAYRIAVPKTVVSTTGPVYVAEIVPLLALASASGCIEVVKFLEKSNFIRAREAIAGAVASAFAVSLIMFIPPNLNGIHRSVEIWLAPSRYVQAASGGNALVFANILSEPGSGDSWAYYPPNPSPKLDDDVIFVREPTGEDATKRMFDFWKRRFSDRTAWIFRYQDGKPRIKRLPENTSSSPTSP